MLSLRRMKKNLSITICPSLDIWKDFIDTFAFWAITWGRLEDTFKAAALHLSKLMRANFPDKCDIAQVFKKWNVHQLAYYDVHQITTPDGSCSKLHFHEWCIMIIFWWYTYWNNAYESQLWFFSLFLNFAR